MLSIIPVPINGEIEPGANISKTIIDSIKLSKLNLEEFDILVIAQKIISKAETRMIDIDSVIPSTRALKFATVHDKDPRLIQLILDESRKVIRVTQKHLITQTKHGFICANAGIDQSNVSNNPRHALLLPKNPDRSARNIRKSIFQLARRKVSVIICDTFGRPFRNGQTNVAIGISGINPLKSYIGTPDIFGRKLKVTEIAVADEIASAAELVMGKTLQIPVAIVRGYPYQLIESDPENKIDISILIRNEKDDLFVE